MMPSASLGSTTRGLYEPIHGSAPDIAGRNIANPLGTILSGALLLRHSLGLEQEAAAIEKAVSQVLDEGYRTATSSPKAARKSAALRWAISSRRGCKGNVEAPPQIRETRIGAQALLAISAMLFPAQRGHGFNPLPET